MTERTAAWHVDRFEEFARYKAEVGEPSPHMSIVLWLSKDEPKSEKLWRAGCYLNPYSVLSAEVIWNEWTVARVLHDEEGFAEWLTANWTGIHTRTERRCVRTPANFIRAQVGYARWLAHGAPSVARGHYADPHVEYDTWWKSATSVPFFGRYITIRLLEYFYRVGIGQPLYDIRSIGGWSPIKCLMLFRPQDTDMLATGKAEPVDRVARDVMAELAERGLPMTPYVFAALLCEYRVAWEKRHQYPGWTIDQELEYTNGKHAEYWRQRGHETRLFEARRALFPEQTLGELHGWQGRRYDVAALLADEGYVWSDLRYDYAASRAALATPVAA